MIISPYHHTFRPQNKTELINKKLEFKKILTFYNLNLNRVKAEIKRKKIQLIGVEIPEGLKIFTANLATYLKNELDVDVIISAAPCFGACDIKINQFINYKVRYILHFGNEQIPNRKLNQNIIIRYIPMYIKINPQRILNIALKYLVKKKIFNVGLLSSIQYICNLDTIKEFLTKKGINVFIGKGNNRIKFRGQLLGCNFSSAYSILNDVEKFILFEGGNFHAKGLVLATKKDAICFNILTNKIVKYSYKKLYQEEMKKRNEKLKKLIKAKNVGILISSKNGQKRDNLAQEIKKTYDRKGYNTTFLICDYLDIRSINIMNFDFYISTICPRVALDEFHSFKKPILNPIEAILYINNEFNKIQNDLFIDQIN